MFSPRCGWIAEVQAATVYAFPAPLIVRMIVALGAADLGAEKRSRYGQHSRIYWPRSRSNSRPPATVEWPSGLTSRAPTDRRVCSRECSPSGNADRNRPGHCPRAVPGPEHIAPIVEHRAHVPVRGEQRVDQLASLERIARVEKSLHLVEGWNATDEIEKDPATPEIVRQRRIQMLQVAGGVAFRSADRSGRNCGNVLRSRGSSSRAIGGCDGRVIPFHSPKLAPSAIHV